MNSIDDEICIILKNYDIRISFNEESQKYVFAIIDENMSTLFFTFDTLEDGMSFVENDVANCFNIDEIKDLYMKSYLKLTKEKK